jgi:hypothetical protein
MKRGDVWLIFRGEILFDVHALGPHAAELAPSRQGVCRCFDESKAEGVLDLMRETGTSLRDCVRGEQQRLQHGNFGVSVLA